jgi:hypothetical protein
MRDERRARVLAGNCDPHLAAALGKCTSLLLATATAGSVASITDLKGGSAAVQAVAGRQPVGAAGANGLALLQFTSDNKSIQWPLGNTTNNQATKVGYWIRFKPASVASLQRLLNMTIAAGAAVGLERLSFYAVNRTLQTEVYASNATGRVAVTASNVLTAGVAAQCYLQYDSSRGGDANLALYVDAAAVTQNFSAIGGLGSTGLGALQQPTGNCMIGAFNNSNTPTQPITDGGQLGPVVAAAFNDNLTLPEIQAFNRWMIAT